MATSHKVPLATGATSPDTGGEQRGGVGSKEEKVRNKEKGGNKDEEVGSKEEGGTSCRVQTTAARQ